MRKVIFSVFTLVLALVLFTACKKENKSTATINFSEPMANDSLQLGESLHVEGSISGTGELHGYTLSITNKTSGTLIYTGTVSDHKDAYAFHEHWVNNVTDTSTIEVLVEVALDHDGNKTSKNITCIALP